MATSTEFESLDDEIKELLNNYEHKKATYYEPCTLKNIKECLIGLHEVRLFQVNIKFVSPDRYSSATLSYC
jgi:hypothetical protein